MKKKTAKGKNEKMVKKEKSSRKGIFIVFEGLDGSGQSTQLALLQNYLNLKGYKTHVTAEPSNSLIGGLIRALLTKHWSLSNTGMQLLYCADRAHHLETEVLPAMEAGNVVISSRYFFSTIAFGSLNNDINWLESLNEKFPKPDITLFVKVSPKECMRRIHGSRFRTEFFEQEQKMNKVLQTYVKISKDKKYKNFYTIDGEQSIDKVSQDIVKIIDKHLK